MTRLSFPLKVASRQAAINDLVAFRHSTEKLDVANYAVSAAREVFSLKGRKGFEVKKEAE